MTPPRWPPPRVLSAVLLVAALGVGCQGDAGPEATFERGPVDRGLQEIMVDVIGDGQPTNGAPLEGCPVLGTGGLEQVAQDSGIELDAEDSAGEDSAGGFAVVLGTQYSLTCTAGGLSLNVSQTRALDAEEYVDTLPSDPPDGAPTLSAGAGADFGDLTEDRVFTSEGEPVAGWVDNGLVIAVSFAEDSDGTVDDAGAVLATARDAVVETLAQAAASDDGFAVPGDDELARSAIVEAMQQALPEEARGSPRFESLGEGACPVFDEDDADDLGDRLGVDLAPSAGDIAVGLPNPFVTCRLGPDQTLTVSLDRPRSIEEFAFREDSPLVEGPDRDVRGLDEGLSDLDADRTMLIEEPGGRQAGWINNGFVVTVTVPEGADPGEVVSAVVPVVLENLGLG